MLGISPEIVLFGLGVGILIGLTAITKTLGGYKHLRKGTVDLAVSKWLAYGGIPGALTGVLLVDRLHKAYGKSFDDILIGCIAGALIIVATVVLVRTLLLSHLAAQERETYHFSRRAAIAAIALGFVLGVMLGMTSVGSGALIGVAMIVIFKLTPQRVAGSSVFLAAMLLWVAGLAQVVSGNVDYGLVGNILIGSMPGVWIGAHFVDRVPAQALRVTLGAVLLGSALAMVNNAGGKMPIAVIFGAPIAVGVLGYLLHLRSQRSAAKTTTVRPDVAAPTLAATASSAPAIVAGKPGLTLGKQP
jgi:hypothetical protein